MSEEPQGNPLEDALQNLNEEFDVEREHINLSEHQFLFANLLFKTDFSKSEISEFLEYEPTDEEMKEIQQKVKVWRSGNQNNRSSLPKTSTIII